MQSELTTIGTYLLCYAAGFISCIILMVLLLFPFVRKMKDD